MSARRGTRGDRLLRGAGLAVVLATGGGLALLLSDVVGDGAGRLTWAFLLSRPSGDAARAGIWPALAGTAWLMALTAALALPIGMGAAIYLEEYMRRTWWSRLIELNITNLAGVPSVVYGLLGLGLFVQALHLGRTLIAGAATLALLVLPLVILTTRDALRAVPEAVRHASLALGATRWQTIWRQVLPQALPGILSGVTVALARAAGETAPLLIVGAFAFVPFAPDGVWSPFTALPVQIFTWLSRPQETFRASAAAAILVLLALVAGLHALAAWLRSRPTQERVR